MYYIRCKNGGDYLCAWDGDPWERFGGQQGNRHSEKGSHTPRTLPVYYTVS